MAWIEVHQNLVSHPKLLDVADDLEICAPQAMGHLLCLWMWALEYAQDGDLARFSVRRIEQAAQWPGEPGALVQALQDRGWLDGMVIHDWWEYAGKLVERRRQDAERKAAARQGERPQRQAADNQPAAERQPAEVPAPEEALQEGQARGPTPTNGGDVVSHGRPPDVRGMSDGRPMDVLRNTTTTIPNPRSPNRTRKQPPPPPDASEEPPGVVVAVEAAFDEVQIVSGEARQRAMAGWLAVQGEALRPVDVLAWGRYVARENEFRRNGNRLGAGVIQTALEAGRLAPAEHYLALEMVDDFEWKRYVIE